METKPFICTKVLSEQNGLTALGNASKEEGSLPKDKVSYNMGDAFKKTCILTPVLLLTCAWVIPKPTG